MEKALKIMTVLELLTWHLISNFVTVPTPIILPLHKPEVIIIGNINRYCRMAQFYVFYVSISISH